MHGVLAQPERPECGNDLVVEPIPVEPGRGGRSTAVGDGLLHLVEPQLGDRGQSRLRSDLGVSVGAAPVTVSRVDRLVTRTKQDHGVAPAKAVRTVVSGVLGLAVRHDALTQNPVRDVNRIESTASAARALTLTTCCRPRSQRSATPLGRSCWSAASTTATGNFPVAGSRSARPPGRPCSAKLPKSPESRSS